MVLVLTRTADGRLFVLLEVVVDEAQDKRGLPAVSMRKPCFQPNGAHTFPTAASPSRTSLTLLLGLAAFPESAMVYFKVSQTVCRAVCAESLEEDARAQSGILYAEQPDARVDRCLERSASVGGTGTVWCRFGVACGLRGMQGWRTEEAHHQR